MEPCSHSSELVTFVSSFLHRIDWKRQYGSHQRLVPKSRSPSITCSAVPSLENTDSNRFVDLRTLKTTSWESVNQAQNASSPSHTTNLPLDSISNANAIPFSSTEQAVIQTLLSGQSVLFSIAVHEPIADFLFELVGQVNERNQTVLYCAPTIPAAQRVYTVLKSSLASSSTSIVLETGDVNSKPFPTSYSNPQPCIIITTNDVYIRGKSSILNSVSVLVLEQIGTSGSHWEEILLQLPSRVSACLVGRDMNKIVGEHILLWVRSMHRKILPFSSSRFSTGQDSSERANDGAPRLFIFNVARQEKPVEFSLPKARAASSEATLQKNSNYASTLLEPCSDFEVLNVEEMRFRNQAEAEYVDFASIILGDCLRTKPLICKVPEKRSSRKRGRSSAPTRSSLELRDECFRMSNIFPVIGLFRDENSALCSANTVLNAAEDPFLLLWDNENRERLHDVLQGFVQNHEDDLNAEDHTHLSFLARGIGIIHNGVLPSIMVLAEELFRCGRISTLFVDVHVSRSRLTNLPQAKSVLVQSSALSSIHDTKKGLVPGRVAMSLANSVGAFCAGNGNVITLWNDDSVDEEEAASDMITGFVQPRSTIGVDTRSTQPNSSDSFTQGFVRNLLGPVRLEPSSRSMWATYDGVIRSMRCFGSVGFKSVVERTVDYYQVWLGGAVLRATREKMQADCKAMETRLLTAKDVPDEIDGSSSENAGQNDVMLDSSRGGGLSLAQLFTNEALRKYRPGTLIGLKVDASQSNEDQHNSAVGSHEELLIWEPTERIKFLPVIFVSLLVEPSDVVKSYVGDSSLLALCITADGTWNAVPPSFVVTEAVEGSPLIAEVESFEAPHLATFDLDSSVGWARGQSLSGPTDTLDPAQAGEKLRELCASNEVEFQVITSKVRAKLNTLSSQSSIISSPIDQSKLHELKLLREQFAQFSEREKQVGESERRLNSAINQVQEVRRDSTLKIVGVLEDSNAIRIHDEEEMEITPLGALASVLPGSFPLFTSACLLLVRNLDQLEPAQLGAFVALVLGVDCERFTMSIEESRSLRQRSVPERVVPQNMVSAVEEIQKSLKILAQRHRSVNVPRAEIVPPSLSVRLATVVCGVIMGSIKLTKDLDKYQRGAIIEDIRAVSQVLRIISDGGVLGEFGQPMRQKAESVLASLRHWPVYDADDFELLHEKSVLMDLNSSH